MRQKLLRFIPRDSRYSVRKGRKKIAFVFGTRPEAIKLAPLIRAFQCYPAAFTTLVIVTAQHREMLDQVLSLFCIIPDYDLDIMTRNQSLSIITSKALEGLEPILIKEAPDLVVVQGDTTTTFVGALAAFYQGVSVAHVEAGLRTGDRWRPFPEEVNRHLTSVVTDLHFAATGLAKKNLLCENISPKDIWITGNTVIDALEWVLEQPYQLPKNLAHLLNRRGVRHILVTAHRRESHGVPIRNICRALLKIVQVMPDVEVIFSVHFNPKVRRDIVSLLQGNERIHIISPLDYQLFVHVMRSVHLILTDSGGIQEEAPSLGIPVLVLRKETERSEGVQTGAVKMIGTDPFIVTNEVQQLLSNNQEYKLMAHSVNPFGDGQSCSRIVKHVAHYLNVVTLMKAESKKIHESKLK